MSNAYTNILKKRMPAPGDFNWDDEWHDNERIDDVVSGALLSANRVISGGAVTSGGGLTSNFSAAAVRLGHVLLSIDAGSLTLEGALAGKELCNWVYVNSGGSVVTSLSPPSGSYIPLALVDTNDTGIVRIADLRPLFIDNSIIPAVEEILATSANIVDVLTYITKKDSDEGVWVDKAATQPWYWDPLNTATRGSTREFPTIVNIVAETSKITISDPTVAGSPMWRVHDLTGYTISAVWMAQGILCAATNAGLYTYNYLTATAFWYTTTSSPAIINNACSDVTMTVLPDAPIDPLTGIQVPTIVVGTNGGLSVIDGPAGVGTVVDQIYGTVPIVGVGIFNGKLGWRGGTGAPVTFTAPLANYLADYSNVTLANHATNYGGTVTTTTSIPAQLANGTFTKGCIPGKALSGEAGLTLISDDLLSCAHITTDYNTGRMRGDIRRALICEANGTTETLGNLVTNGTFDSDTGWSKGAGWTISGGTANKVAGSAIGLTQQAGVVDNKKYSIKYTVLNYSAGSVLMILGGNAWGVERAANGSYEEIITAAGGNGIVYVYASSAFVGSVDNITVTEAIPDHSVKQSVLTVNGALTRSPVATGAELQCISGFSASNYLSQGYSADLDLPGDFLVRGWVILGGSTNEEMLLGRMALNASGNGLFIRKLVDNTIEVQFWGIGGCHSSVPIVNTAMFIAVRRIGTVVSLFVNDSVVSTFGSAVDLTNTSAVLYIGKLPYAPYAFPAITTKMSEWKIEAGTVTDADIAEIYRAELAMFQPETKCTLQGSGSSVTAVSHDTKTDALFVGSTDKITVFNGLRVIDSIDSNSVRALSAQNKILLSGDSVEAVVRIPQINLKSRLLGV